MKCNPVGGGKDIVYVLPITSLGDNNESLPYTSDKDNNISCLCLTFRDLRVSIKFSVITSYLLQTSTEL